MSYAAAAAKGPKQSAEEAYVKFVHYQAYRAPAPVELERTEDSVQSLIDVDSPHISSVPSDFESQSVKTDTQAERIEREEEAKAKAKELKEKAAQKAAAAKAAAKRNADHPVVISNAVGLAVIGSILGFLGYRKYTQGELTGKVVAAWAGVVGLFAAGDFYVSQYFFKRNPPK